MEEGGGSKRSGASARQGLEQPSNPRPDNGAAATKKMDHRKTPTWVRAATGSQTAKDRGGGVVKDGAERLQDITISQQSFAAQLSQRDEAKHPRVHRWAAPSQTQTKSPSSDHWPVRLLHEQPVAGGGSLVRMTEDITRLKVAQSEVDSSSRPVVGDDQSRYDDGFSEEKGYDGSTEERPARSGPGQDFDDGADEADGAGHKEKKEEGEGETGEGEGSNGTTNTKELGIQGGGQGREAAKPDGALNRGKASVGSKAAGGLVKGPWTKEEDQKIIDCITQNITKWSEIAERVEGRVGKQCRERWFNHLDPSLKKSSWTPAEDEILVQGQARFGNSWTKIAKLLPGRSENAVKNRWNSAARKKGNKATRMANKISSAYPTNGADAPEYMRSQVSMPPEQGVDHAQYFTMQSFNPAHHIRPQTAPYAGWSAPPVDMPGRMRLNTQVPQSILGALPKQHRPDQRSPRDGAQRTLGSETLPEQVYGHLAADPEQTYDQPVLPSTLIDNSSRTLSPPQLAPGVLGMPNNGGARSVAIAAPRSEPVSALLLSSSPAADDPQSSDSKEDLLGCYDELSLSNTLFNLSLSKTSFCGLTQSFGRHDDSRNEFDEMGTSLGRQPPQEARGGRSAPRGVVTGSEYPSGTGGLSFGERWLDGCQRNGVIPQEQVRQLPVNGTSPHPRLDFTTSVSDLLFGPVQTRAGQYPT